MNYFSQVKACLDTTGDQKALLEKESRDSMDKTKMEAEDVQRDAIDLQHLASRATQDDILLI